MKSYFEMTEDQIKKCEEWQKSQDAIAVKMQIDSGDYKDNEFVSCFLENGFPYYGATGGHISFEFTPTSIGECLVVKHAITKNEINLTDYDSW